jgi:glycosidase
MMNFKFLILVSFALVFFSCKKEKDPIVENTPTGYVQYGTPFANVPATEDVVMYEVNLRAFSTAGNLQGVISRLSEIKALGVNTIWLMPIYSEGVLNGVNSPYCVKNYKEVSTEYGNLEDLRQLTTLAHAQNMTVILDWVANHTSWDNPWITAHPEWYTKDGAGNIIKPAGTNWNDVADLNFSNADMRLEMIDAMKYWVLEANVDGFRCDYADGVPFDFWSQAITALKSIPNRSLVFLAEGIRNDHYTAGFDMTYGWNFYTATQNCWGGTATSGIFSTDVSEYSSVPAEKHKIRFTTNHDESAWNSSPMTLYNGKLGALAASVSTIFMRGVPLIYCGQEVGRTSLQPFFTKSPINWNANQDMLLAYKNMLQFYSSSNAARKGAFSTFAGSSDILCFQRTYGTEKVLIMLNARDSVVTYTIPPALQGTTWINAMDNSTMTFGATQSFTNYQYLILKNQ